MIFICETALRENSKPLNSGHLTLNYLSSVVSVSELNQSYHEVIIPFVPPY